MTRPIVLYGACDRHNFGDLLFARIAEALLPGEPLIHAGLADRDLRAEGGVRVVARSRLAAALGGRPARVLHVGGELLTCSAWQAAMMLQPPGDVAAKLAYLDGWPVEQRGGCGASSAATTPRRTCCRGPRCRASSGSPISALAESTSTRGAGAARRGDRQAGRRRPRRRARRPHAGVATGGRPRGALGTRPRAARCRAARRGDCRSRGAAIADRAAPLPCCAERCRRATWPCSSAPTSATTRRSTRWLPASAVSRQRGARASRCFAPARRRGTTTSPSTAVYRRLAARLRGCAARRSCCSSRRMCSTPARWSPRARGYVGSSLHGRIVAMAHGVPQLNLHRTADARRVDKQRAYAATWEAPGLPASAGDADTMAGALDTALDVDAAVLVATARRLANAARVGYVAAAWALD